MSSRKIVLLNVSWAKNCPTERNRGEKNCPTGRNST